LVNIRLRGSGARADFRISGGRTVADPRPSLNGNPDPSASAVLVSPRRPVGPAGTTAEPVTAEREPTRPPAETVPWSRVSVIVPALNEARNLPHVFALIPPGVHEVVLVDGRSVDGTVEVARQLRPDVRVVTQNRKGKGNALACGFAAATGDIIAMVDADGSADPGEIPRFVEALLAGADFAKGSRFVQGGGSSDITRFRTLGNRLLTGFFNACYGRKYTDLCYGFNLFWRRCVPVLGLDATSAPRPGGDGRLWGDGFEVETLIHVRAARAGLEVTEVPSFEHSRIHGVSNLNAFSDGLRVVRTIFKERRLHRQPESAPAPTHVLQQEGDRR
jgi:glycosyltransferase involved in cell wall biosynthesis